MTADLITWLRQQLDQQQAGLEQELREYLGTHPEHGIRFRLAEVEAKRRILDLHHETELESEPDHDPMGAGCAECGHFDWPCETIRLLAQPYAGRDGWQEQWHV
jgi:hypothetical protein